MFRWVRDCLTLPRALRCGGQARARVRWLTGLTLAAILGLGCETSAEAPAAMHEIAPPGLHMPRLPGWQRLKNADPQAARGGGLVFRLHSNPAVTGAPRLDVLLQSADSAPTDLEDFLTHNLREMARMEKKGKLELTDVQQEPVALGPRRGYRVRHDYLLGQGKQQVAITQISLFMVLDGRGVTVTAAGRSELFAPLAKEIDAMLRGLSPTPPPETQSTKAAASAEQQANPSGPNTSARDATGADAVAAPDAAPRNAKNAPTTPSAPPTESLVQPIDLGKIGE